jgi:hypothetical protein
MSPLRHDGESLHYRPSGPSWIDEAIAEARERGEFDNLPGTGEPLRFKENPFAGDWEMAYHVLENAGMAPPWMEMSREIREGTAKLAEMREGAAHRLAEQLPLARESAAPPVVTRPRFWWWPFRRRAPEPYRKEPRRPTLAELEAERQWARREYLEQAATVDEIIAAYNAWLPDNLRRLQKPRLPASKAAAEFDAACPPLALTPRSVATTPRNAPLAPDRRSRSP